MPQSEWVKDDDAVLDYGWDWKALTNGTGTSDWLGAAETITAAIAVTVSPVTVPPLVVDSSARADANTSVTAWLSGGLAGTEYIVTCHIVTDNVTPRTDERSIKIKVEER